MQINPYLNFDGRCREAFTFYAECLGGKITMMMTHADAPMKDHVSPDWAEAILHARLEVGGVVLLGSDAPPEYYHKPEGTYVSIHVDNAADADRIFNALAENGQIHMPIGKTFWAERFGMLADRFGVLWMINGEQTV